MDTVRPFALKVLRKTDGCKDVSTFSPFPSSNQTDTS